MTQGLDQQSVRVERAIDHGMASLTTSRGHVQRVAEAFSQAQAAVSSAARGAHDIALSVREQTSASTDIAKNVERIAQMAEENHSSVNHANDAARSLKELANGLQEAVSKFKIA